MERLYCARYTEKDKQICEYCYFEMNEGLFVDFIDTSLHNLLSLALRRAYDGNDNSLYRFNGTVS